MAKYDWEKIEKEYRAGQLSIREIANTHGCSEGAIRKRMKKLGVERDLSAKVAAKVRSEAVRTEVRTAHPETEKEIIEETAARGIEVSRGQQKRIRQGNEAVERLFAQLNETIECKEEIAEDIEQETEGDDDNKRRNRMLQAVALKSNASTANSLALALKTLVALERETYNLDADKEEVQTKTLQDLAASLDGKTKGPMGANGNGDT